MRYIHQFDDKGNHRLGTVKYDYGSPTKESVVRWGKWASYKTPAMLGQYLAVTEYYQGSQEFPDSKLLYRVQADVWPLESETI